MREDENQFKVIYSQPRVPDCIKNPDRFRTAGFDFTFESLFIYIFVCLFV